MRRSNASRSLARLPADEGCQDGPPRPRRLADQQSAARRIAVAKNVLVFAVWRQRVQPLDSGDTPAQLVERRAARVWPRGDGGEATAIGRDGLRGEGGRRQASGRGGVTSWGGGRSRDGLRRRARARAVLGRMPLTGRGLPCGRPTYAVSH